MVLNDIEKFVYINENTIICTKGNLNTEDILKIRYKIDKENKEIRLYDVPRILTFQDKSFIYYALLENYYFFPQNMVNDELKDEHFEEYVVRENGYTYHEFNEIKEENNGILGELLFEITRQEIETEKLSKIRDIYDLLIRNIDEIGVKPICIAFNGIMPDFKDVFKVIIYMFEYDKKLKSKKDKVIIFKRSGLFGGNKRIYIVSNKILDEIKKENDTKNIQKEEKEGESSNKNSK